MIYIVQFVLILVTIGLAAICFSFEKLSRLNQFFLAFVLGLACGRVEAYIIGLEDYQTMVMFFGTAIAIMGFVIQALHRSKDEEEEEGLWPSYVIAPFFCAALLLGWVVWGIQ